MKHPSSTLPKLRGALAVAAALALLAACGGGGGGSPDYNYETADAPPDGTAASSGSVLAFINDLAGSPLEGREPYNVDALTTPTDNTDGQEPARTSIDQ